MKHVHAEVIHAFADGAKIQVRANGDGDDRWEDCPIPNFTKLCEYRVKPAAPKWPQTTMDDFQLSEAALEAVTAAHERQLIANAAIAHECSTGALVPADKVREIEAKAREEGIKEGVSEAMKVSSEFAREIALHALQVNEIYPTSDELSSIMTKVYP